MVVEKSFLSASKIRVGTMALTILHIATNTVVLTTLHVGAMVLTIHVVTMVLTILQLVLWY